MRHMCRIYRHSLGLVDRPRRFARAHVGPLLRGERDAAALGLDVHGAGAGADGDLVALALDAEAAAEGEDLGELGREAGFAAVAGDLDLAVAEEELEAVARVELGARVEREGE